MRETLRALRAQGICRGLSVDMSYVSSPTMLLVPTPYVLCSINTSYR